MTEEEKRAYEILYEKIIFVDKYRMLKPHWIKFHNYIEKLQKENEELKKGSDINVGSIPKDKIREIIEELNKDIEEEFKKCSGRGPTIALHSLTFCRDEFKELLEEE